MKRSNEKQLVAIGIRRKGESGFKYQTLENRNLVQTKPKTRTKLLKV